MKRPNTKSLANESKSLSIFVVLACNVQKNRREMSSLLHTAQANQHATVLNAQ